MALIKLDDVEPYAEKLAEMFKNNKIKSITVVIMGVACCYSLYSLVERALRKAEVDIPLIKETIKVNVESEIV